MDIRAKMERALTAPSALLAAVLLAAAAPGALAQGAGEAARSLDAHWLPWLGCWTPVGAAGSLFGGAPHGRVVCVIPDSGRSTVNVATVDSGRVEVLGHIGATGEREPTSESGCAGWRSAHWSPDGRRLYLRSEATCAGGVRRTSTGVFSMAPGGEWLDVRGIAAGQSSGVRVARYRQTDVPAEMAGQLSPVLGERSLAVTTAREAAAAPVTTADVIEASRELDAAAVEAWLVALHQDFEVDAKQLVRLADAGVPDRVIDVMVALSYPKVFAIAPSRDVALRPSELPQGYTGVGEGGTQSIVLEPYGYSPYDLGYYPWLGYGAYGLGYGYGGYGFGYGWYPGGGPVVIIQNPGSTTPAPHGRVVNGRGYSRGGSDQPAGAGSSTRRTSGAGAGGQSGGRSGTTGTSTGRTAKPRP